jgi:hypothetical protein
MTVAGHKFERNGLDTVCVNMTKTEPPEACRMSRAALYQATEADIDKTPNSAGYGAGFACHGRLSRTEYSEIQADKAAHEKRVDAMMSAMRELSSG